MNKKNNDTFLNKEISLSRNIKLMSGSITEDSFNIIILNKCGLDCLEMKIFRKNLLISWISVYDKKIDTIFNNCKIYKMPEPITKRSLKKSFKKYTNKNMHEFVTYSKDSDNVTMWNILQNL